MTNQAMSSDIRRYALVGAQARLTEIAQEADAIRRAFPELRDGQGTNGNGSREEKAETSATSRRRSGGNMSPAQRKAVGERMKKYWASRRAGGEASAAAASESPVTGTATITGQGAKRGPRTMSPEARKRISDAQKARWAKQRGHAGTTGSESAKTSSKTPRPGASKRTSRGTAKHGARKLSAASRKRMSEAQKKRWETKRTAA